MYCNATEFPIEILNDKHPYGSVQDIKVMTILDRISAFHRRYGLKALIWRIFEYSVLHYVARFLAYIGDRVGKDSKQVLIGASKGERYDDNSRYVYEFLLEHSTLDPVWVTRNREVYRRLRDLGNPVEYAYSISGVIALMRSPIGVFSNSLEDISFHPSAVPRSMTLIALRHGISLKRTRFATDGPHPRKHLRERALTDYAISPSEFLTDMQEPCLQIGRDNHIITGLPRNDQLLNPRDRPSPYLDSIVGDPGYENTILYAPTWRHGAGPTEFFPFDDFDSTELEALLETHQARLLVRPHPKDLEWYERNPELREFSRLRDMLDGPSSVHLATHRDVQDTNAILKSTDILVTDYSSIYLDFLLLDRPIIFVPYDREEFEANVGFLSDYDLYTPGPKVTTFLDFTHEIDALLDGQDGYSDERKRVLAKTHRYVDANSSERVAALIEQKIQEF